MRSKQTREDSPAQNIKTPVLITRRLILRLPHSEDIESLAALANNKGDSAMFDQMPCPFARADAEDFIRRAESGKTGYYVYAITCAKTGAFMGCGGIGAYKGAEGAAGIAAAGQARAAEAAFWLGEPFSGKGYGEEVMIALVDVAFRATEIETLYARALLDNEAAREILQQCGFSLLQAGGHIGKGGRQAETITYYHLDRAAWLELRRVSSERRGKNSAPADGRSPA